MSRRVEWWRITDFAVKRSASIFRFRQSKNTASSGCSWTARQWRRRLYVPTKDRQQFISRQGVASQNTRIFIIIESIVVLPCTVSPIAAARVITVNSGSELSETGTHRYSGVKLWSWQRSWWSLITFHWSPSVKYSVYKERRVESMHSSNQQNTKENSMSHKRISSPSPEMNALQSNVFLNGMHPLLFTNIWRSDFSCKVTVVLLDNQLYQSQ
jgi:hypothetical protein